MFLTWLDLARYAAFEARQPTIETFSQTCIHLRRQIVMEEHLKPRSAFVIEMPFQSSNAGRVSLACAEYVQSE